MERNNIRARGLIRNVSRDGQFCSDIGYFWNSDLNAESAGNTNSRSAWVSDSCQDLHRKKNMISDTYR